VTRRVALALVAAGLAVLPAGAQAAWTAPQSVTRSGIARSPSVDVDPVGRLAVAYVRGSGSTGRIELRRGTLRDGVSGAPVLVARDVDRPGTTSVRFDGIGGSTLTAWDHGLAASSSALLIAFDGAPLLPLGPFAGSVAPVVLRAFDGSVRLVLHGEAGLSVLRPGGERIDLPSAGRDARVAIGAGGEIVAAWTQDARLLVAVASPGGAFGAPVALGTSGSPREPLLAAGADGRVLVAWLAAASGRTAIEGASLTPGGGFSATIPLVAPDARAPVLAAASNGELVLAYLDASGPTRAGHVGTDRGILRLARLRPDGTPIGRPLRISGPLERTSGAGVAVDPSGVQVVWATTASVRARRVAPGGLRGRVRVLSSTGVDGAAVPAVAGGSSGGVAAAWVARGRVVVVRSRAVT
jgi:hypothetical protein